MPEFVLTALQVLRVLRVEVLSVKMILSRVKQAHVLIANATALVNDLPLFLDQVRVVRHQ